jgi:large subunit ribosomal protein L22
MSVTAKLANYRQSPRKVRLVATLLKGKSIEDALVEVRLLEKRAAPIIEKLIKSAVANAKSQGLDVSSLYIKELRVDKGVVIRRFMPRAMGRAFPIMKRSSHVSVVVAEKIGKKESAPEAKAKEITKKPEKKTVKKTTKVAGAKKTTK